MRDTSNRQTYIGVLTGLFAVLTQAVIGFFLTPFIVRTMGEEANGFAQLANNFVLYASLLTVAFNSMGGRFLSVSYHRGEMEKAQRYYSSLLVCNVAIVLVLLPLAAYVVLRLDSLLAIDTAAVGDVKLLFLCVFLNFFVNQFVALLSMSMCPPWLTVFQMPERSSCPTLEMLKAPALKRNPGSSLRWMTRQTGQSRRVSSSAVADT